MVKPIDLTAAGWAALDQSDPLGALKIDALNDYLDRTCR